MERIVSQREMSWHLHYLLDDLGFSKQRCWERIHTMNKCSRAKDISTKRILNTNSIEKIFVGSQREGIGLGLLNDLDILQINQDVSCCLDPNLAHENAKVVFELKHQSAPPGYCFLKLASQNHEAKPLSKIAYALVGTQKGQYLSSKLFMGKNDDVLQYGDGFFSKNTHYKSPEGPSIPIYVDEDFSIVKTYISKLNLKRSEMDYVRAFPCRADHILQAWFSRKRKHNWPSQKTTAHVMGLPAHVVPVGQTGSAGQDFQWRICFTLAEIHLVQSFNNTQTKLFVLLKLIAQYYLKPVCACMTSYVMKTVVLWLAETIPQKKFRRKHLVARLYSALKLLQESLQSGFLPNYMIPERNLYAGKLEVHEQELVLAKIDFLIQNGQKIIHNFLCKPQELDNWTDTILEGIYVANMYDKVTTCRNAVLTVDEMAEYNTTMFLYKSKWMMFLYKIVFLIVPSAYTFGLDVILPNDKTLQIPLKDKHTSNDRRENVSKACNSRNNKKPEPDLDLFITEEEIKTKELLQLCPVFFAIDCGVAIGCTSSEVFDFSLMKQSNIAFMITFFLVVLFAIIAMVIVVYNFKRNYCKQTYIENLEDGQLEIKMFIPKSLHKTYMRCIITLFCVETALLTLLAMSKPEKLKVIPFGLLTLYMVVALLLHVALRKLTSKPKIKKLQSSANNLHLSQVFTESLPFLPV